MRMPTGIVVGILLFTHASTEAQEGSATQTRLFIAPVADPGRRKFDSGPTRYEYLDRLMDAPECSGIVPVSKAGIADFSVWFEFKKRFRSTHYMTLWDASGHWVAGGEAGVKCGNRGGRAQYDRRRAHRIAAPSVTT